MTHKAKTDPATLLALGGSLGLQGFDGAPAAAKGQHLKQPAATKESAASAKAPAPSNASSAIALAKHARLLCVADEAGAQ